LNKIYQLSVIAIFMLSNIRAQEVLGWDLVKNFSALVEKGTIPTKEILKLEKEYKILLIDNSKSIAAMQHLDGGCIVIFPSTHKVPFIKVGNLVVSNPVSLSSNGKTIFWEKAVLDTSRSNKDVFVLNLHRKDDPRTDSVTLSRTNHDNIDHWKFGLTD
jgi:hypothetical protein